MNLPNEVTILILSFMPKSVVKQARLACQLWAELGAQFLFDTIYISPRRIGMDMFEKITRHKTLRNIPRHLVYDSAGFEQLDRMAYASYIHWQYHEGLFDVLGDAFFSVQEMIRYVPIEIIDESATEVDVQLKNHPVFDEGFWEYLKNANEFGNIFKPDWFRRVSRGLKRLGPIESVIMCNTWEMIYNELDTVLTPPAYDVSFTECEHEAIRHLASQLKCNVDTARLISRNCIRSDGKRLVGSPSARASSTTTLRPSGTHDWNTTDRTQVMLTGRSSGYHECHGLVKLLTSIGKCPKGLNILGGFGIDQYRAGIAAHFFDPMQNPEPAKYLDLADSLTSLRLTIADNDLTSLGHRLDYQILQQFLWKARELEVLALEFPCARDPVNGQNFTLISLYPMFSEIQSWLPPGLKKLHLSGVSVSYREFATHLFLCLPHLTSLKINEFHLKQGCYKDFVKGLRHHTQLQGFDLVNTYCDWDDSNSLPPAMTAEDRKDYEIFAKQVSHYVTTGEDPPDLGRGERDVQFDDWLKRMKAEQKQLMASHIGQDTAERSFLKSSEFLGFVAKAVASYKKAPSIYL
ncbi:MAG: hypothetical protein Q9221_006988 [Calogaya cf. arnoldii]